MSDRCPDGGSARVGATGGDDVALRPCGCPVEAACAGHTGSGAFLPCGCREGDCVGPAAHKRPQPAPPLPLDLEDLEDERDEAVRWIGVVRDELVMAGGKRGDRTVALANLRVLISERAALRARVAELEILVDSLEAD